MCNDNSNLNKQTEMTELKKEFFSLAAVAAEAVVTSVAGSKIFQKAVHSAGRTHTDVLKLESLKGLVGASLCADTLLAKDFIPGLAQAIDRMWAKNDGLCAAEASVLEECAPNAKENLEEVIPVMATSVDGEENDEDDEESFAGLNLSGLDFIDAMEDPEAYASLLEQERNGQIQIVTRYRRSFLSRLIQSQGEVQENYSILKNHLLSYKGVKSRVSWGYESFNKGRIHTAKINAKSKTLYLYLALDPAAISLLEDGKYNIVDMSQTKKYATVPVLMKIKGPRKLKQAMELIDILCRDNMQLPEVKNFEQQDYTVPYQSTEELVLLGSIRKMVAGIPMSDSKPSVPANTVL